MSTFLNKLISIGGTALAGSIVTGLGTKNSDLAALLSQKNGFFAFESALRVFPAGSSPNSRALDDWNSSGLWRGSYGNLAVGALFFAEDIFGTQFCLKDGGVHSFDPETAEFRIIGETIEEWAKAILEDYDFYTGHSFAHDWQVRNGPLAPSDRLMPKLPFVLGGEFAIENFVAIDGAKAMRCRGNLARQIHDLPDGAQIRFELVD